MDVETSHKPYADKEEMWYYCLAFPEKLQTADGAWDTPQNMSCQLLRYSLSFLLFLNLSFCSVFVFPLFFYITLSTLFSSSVFFLSIVLFLLFFSFELLPALCPIPPPHSVLFSLSLSLSWFCAHAPCLENSSESHCGKFPARLFLCGNLVSQPRCLKIKSRLYLWHLCSKQQLRIDTKSSDEN